MKLYGTTTSPFVRRVRVVAAEVGEPIELVNTANEDGQARLRAINPIWKVPVAEIDGHTIFDSRAIIEWLTSTRGFGGLAPPRDRWRDLNRLNAIDAAIESAIQLFYLRRENVPVDGTPFARRQIDRIGAIFEWLGHQVVPGAHFGDGFGIAELSAVCGLDWMDFRQQYPTGRHTAMVALRSAWSARPSLTSTYPQP